MESFHEFKKSVDAVSRSIKRVNLYVPCAFCGKFVKRYPSQRAQSKMIFCSKNHRAVYYQGLHKSVNQRAFGVSLLVSKSLSLGVDPWTLSKREVSLRE